MWGLSSGTMNVGSRSQEIKRDSRNHQQVRKALFSPDVGTEVTGQSNTGQEHRCPWSPNGLCKRFHFGVRGHPVGVILYWLIALCMTNISHLGSCWNSISAPCYLNINRFSEPWFPSPWQPITFKSQFQSQQSPLACLILRISSSK